VLVARNSAAEKRLVELPGEVGTAGVGHLPSESKHRRDQALHSSHHEVRVGTPTAIKEEELSADELVHQVRYAQNATASRNQDHPGFTLVGKHGVTGEMNDVPLPLAQLDESGVDRIPFDFRKRHSLPPTTAARLTRPFENRDKVARLSIDLR